MPYRIRKLPNQKLYKVYSESGKPLSKKGLSLKKAKAQKIASTLTELGIKKKK
jgi:hypothetical protein